MAAPPLPRLVARLEITNAQGLFDSQSPRLLRGDGLDTARIGFTVKKTLDPTPNTAEIRIWNLSPQTIDLITGTVRKRLEYGPEDLQKIYEMGLNLTAGEIALLTAAPVETVYDNFGLGSVRLSWGYAGADPGSPAPPMSLGFLGGSTNMTVESDGLERVLVIKAEDGGNLIGSGRLQKSYKPGASYVDVLGDLIAACGLAVDKAKLSAALGQALTARGIPVGKLVLAQGYNAAGVPAADQIRSVMDSLELRWSVQDGEFLLVDSDTVLAGYPPLLLSRSNLSLFGNPEPLEAQQMRARTWANAEARPGRQVIVEADAITAQYRIDSVDHKGDTYGGGETQVTLDAVQVIPGVF